MISINTPTAIYAATRAVHFGACLLLSGVYIFDRLIVAPIGAVTRSLVDQKWIPAARTIIISCLILILLSGIGWLLCMTYSDLPEGEAFGMSFVRDVLDQTQFGTLWKWRGVMWLLACATSLLAFSFPRRTIRSASATWSAAIASGALAVSIARAGHGGEGTWIHQTADAAHLLIGSAWPIGLVPLIILLIHLPRGNVPGDAMALIPIVDRFSAMSLSTVALIGISGVVNSWPLIGKWSNLTSTPYGQTLMVKVGLFLVMIGIGALNLLKIRPNLARAIDAGVEPEARRSLAWLRVNVGIEIVLCVGVFLAAGLLGVLPPATEACCSIAGK